MSRYVTPACARSVEDRRVEARVARVQDRVGALGLQERHDLLDARRVDLRRGEAVTEPRDSTHGAFAVDVGEHHPLEERALRRHCRSGAADPAGAEHDDAHPYLVCGKPRSTFEVAGSGHLDVTTFERV